MLSTLNMLRDIDHLLPYFGGPYFGGLTFFDPTRTYFSEFLHICYRSGGIRAFPVLPETGNGRTGIWANIGQCAPISPHGTSEVELNWCLLPFRRHRGIFGFTKNGKGNSQKVFFQEPRNKVLKTEVEWPSPCMGGESYLWLSSIRRTISEKNAKNRKRKWSKKEMELWH